MDQPAVSDATKTATQFSDGAITEPPDDPTHDKLDKKAASTYPDPLGYFEEALKDAERLLKYAAEIGIDLDADTRDHILEARIASGIGWSEQTRSQPTHGAHEARSTAEARYRLEPEGVRQ